MLEHPTDVMSETEIGSTFSVVVPLGKSQPQDIVANPSVGAPITGVRMPVVLLVDDDPAIVDATSMLLESASIEVHSANKGKDAIMLVEGGDLCRCRYIGLSSAGLQGYRID